MSVAPRFGRGDTIPQPGALRNRQNCQELILFPAHVHKLSVFAISLSKQQNPVKSVFRFAVTRNETDGLLGLPAKCTNLDGTFYGYCCHLIDTAFRSPECWQYPVFSTVPIGFSGRNLHISQNFSPWISICFKVCISKNEETVFFSKKRLEIWCLCELRFSEKHGSMWLN